MKLSETAIFIAIGIALVIGLRWYFVVYRNSAGVALGDFIGGIKAGSVERQYALIDDADKQQWPSAKDYDKEPLARGYTERISSVSLAPEVKDLKDPDVVTIEATLGVRGAAGKDLLDNGEAKTVVDKYTLRKDKEGHWKIWLTKSPPENLLKITPNPPGSSF
jgi:hypothetical protein